MEVKKETPNTATTAIPQNIITDLTRAEIVFANEIAILGATNEEIDIALCFKSIPEKRSKVTHRLILTTPHFLRVADLFQKVKQDILAAEAAKKKK